MVSGSLSGFPAFAIFLKLTGIIANYEDNIFMGINIRCSLLLRCKLINALR